MTNTKQSIEDLALFGGRPRFSAPLHVGRPNIGDREIFLDRVRDILDRRWLTNDGPYVCEFEAAIAKTIGCKHCISICNGTVALEIAIRALGLKGEVIVPSFTFVATAHALQWQEITPVFCDIEPKHYTIDPEQVERMITPRTSAIIGVHLWGRPCNVRALESVARRRNLRLIFDAAHAFGCSHDGMMVGNFGDAEVLSFHATKFLNTFEGGAITTNDDALAAKIRLMKNFGFSGYDNVIYIGTNGKMNEVSAAMGLTGLESLEKFIETNRINYLEYRRLLAGLPGIEIASFDEAERNNYQYVIAEIDRTVASVSRDDVVRILHAENVLVRRYFFPGCHQMEPYRSYFPHASLLLPKTNELTERVLSFPTGTSVGSDEISAVCSILRLVIENGAEIARRMGAIKRHQSTV